MISALSKSATTYLAPLLALTAVLLSLFAFLAPVVMLHDRVALLTVTPSNALFSTQTTNVDGPSIFLGALGNASLEYQVCTGLTEPQDRVPGRRIQQA